jgi:HCOMODA/2-hydroxy-3-carboxy-muconic semialdehyde decarboxylase
MISASIPRNGARDAVSDQQRDTSPQRAEIADAAHVLASLGLVTAYGHVSARVGATMIITPAADLGTVTEPGLVEVPLDLRAALPPGAPAEAWAHLALYRARPGAHAIARAQPPSAFAAAATGAKLVPLHGQAAWLGASVPVHDSAHLLRTAQRADLAAAALPAGEALLLRGNGALTLGVTPGIAVARMWLLAAACDTWLAARAAASVTPLTADEVESWRAVADELLPRLWQHLQRQHRDRQHLDRQHLDQQHLDQQRLDQQRLDRQHRQPARPAAARDLRDRSQT